MYTQFVLGWERQEKKRRDGFSKVKTFEKENRGRGGSGRKGIKRAR